MSKCMPLSRKYLDHAILDPRVFLQTLFQQRGILWRRPWQRILPPEDGHHGDFPILAARESPKSLIGHSEQFPRIVPGGIPRDGRDRINMRRSRSIFIAAAERVLVVGLRAAGVPPRGGLEGASSPVARSPHGDGGHVISFSQDGGRGADVDVYPRLWVRCPPPLVGFAFLVSLHAILVKCGIRSPGSSSKHIRHHHHRRLALESNLIGQRPRILRKRTIHIAQQQHSLHLCRGHLSPRGSIHAPISVITLHSTVGGAWICRILSAFNLVGTYQPSFGFVFPLCLYGVYFFLHGGVDYGRLLRLL
mmetsp:Transcript_9981/g.21605  ORF Transcript_9981/g.21605 Transcript_9981/m.21605 type:complete len:305 (-) Transcript_9981:853-1767(-)